MCEKSDYYSCGDLFVQLIVLKVSLLLMCQPIHAIDCVKSQTITYVGTYSCNRLCEKSDYYSCGTLFMQSIIRRIRNIIVHLMILFIICVLDCMRNCNINCFNEHPRSDPSSNIVGAPVLRSPRHRKCHSTKRLHTSIQK